MIDPFKEIKDSNLSENTKQLIINKLQSQEEMYIDIRKGLETDINSLLEVAIVNGKQLFAIQNHLLKILDEYIPLPE